MSNHLLLLTFVCHDAGHEDIPSEGKPKLEEEFQGVGRWWGCWIYSLPLFFISFLYFFFRYLGRQEDLKTFPPWIKLLLVAVPQVVEPVEVEEIDQLLTIIIT